MHAYNVRCTDLLSPVAKKIQSVFSAVLQKLASSYHNNKLELHQMSIRIYLNRPFA